METDGPNSGPSTRRRGGSPSSREPETMRRAPCSTPAFRIADAPAPWPGTSTASVARGSVSTIPWTGSSRSREAWETRAFARSVSETRVAISGRSRRISKAEEERNWVSTIRRRPSSGSSRETPSLRTAAFDSGPWADCRSPAHGREVGGLVSASISRRPGRSLCATPRRPGRRTASFVSFARRLDPWRAPGGHNRPSRANCRRRGRRARILIPAASSRLAASPMRRSCSATETNGLHEATRRS